MQPKIWIILFILFNCLIRICPAQLTEDEKLIFRITGIDESDAIRLEQAGIRLMRHDRLPEAQAVVTETQVNWLIKSGYEVTVLGQAGERVDPEYHTYEELLVYIDSLRSLYPEIMSVDTLGYSHVRQLPIPMVKISDNAATDEDEAVIWYDGVELNRNYDFWWEYGDPQPSSELYHGAAPFSESETIAKRDLILSQKPVLSLTYHSYGEYVVFVKFVGYYDAPDWQVMAMIASDESQSPNWCYQAAGTLEILIETADVFIPSGQSGQQIAAENLQGALYLLERAFKSGITGHAWDGETGEPLPATIEIVGVDNELIEPRTCDSLYGRYTRLLLPGTYTVRAYSENTDTITVGNVAVMEDTLTVLDFELTNPVGIDEHFSVVFKQSVVSNYPNPFAGFTTIE